MKKRFIHLILYMTIVFIPFCSIKANGIQPVDVDASQRMQTVEGWGVSLCWWAYMCGQWEEARIDSMIDWLVSPNGLNYNVFRYNIGGGDDPQNRNCERHHMAKGKGLRAEMPGFKADANAPYDWQADSAQIKIMRKIKEKRPDAIFEAFSNSAPWYMTKSGCCGGNSDKNADNLKPECYADFANYLVDVCKHIKDEYGIEFRTLDPFNEPQTDYWYQNGSQEGCHFDVASQQQMIRTLYPILKNSGLNTVISASDETCTAHSLNALEHYDRDVIKMVGQWNTHTYMGTKEEKSRLSLLTDSLGLRLWQSETGNGGRGIDGNIKMLQRLFDDMRYLKPVTWCDWQYFGEHDTQWCLVSGNFRSQDLYRTKNYYIREQVTRFIKQGYSILQVDEEHTLAAVSPDGKIVVVVCLNDDSKPHRACFNIKGINVSNAEVYTTDRENNLVHSSLPMDDGKVDVIIHPLSVKTILFF